MGAIEDTKQVWQRVKACNEHYRLSPSNLDLIVPDKAQGCMYSARRDIPRPPRIQRAAEQLWGSFGHAGIAALVNHGAVNIPKIISKIGGLDQQTADAFYDEFIALDLPGMIGDIRREHPTVRAEVGYQINLDTGKASSLGDDLDHDMAQELGQQRAIKGVIDLRWNEDTYQNGKLTYRKTVVTDWKFSRAQHISRRIDDCKQLMCYAAMAFNAEVANEVEIRVRFLDHGDDEPQPSHTFKGRNELRRLSDFVTYLKTLAPQIDESEPNPGPWCRERFCPLLGTCPATVAAAVELSPEPEPAPDPSKIVSFPLVLAGGSDIVSPEHFEYVLNRVKMVEAATKRAMALLTQWADERGGVKLADGRIWKEYEQRVEKIVAMSQEDLIATLSEWMPANEARELCPATVSKKALELAIKAKTGRGKKQEAFREVVGKLKSSGFTQAEITHRHEARKPRPEDELQLAGKATTDVTYDEDGCVVDD